MTAKEKSNSSDSLTSGTHLSYWLNSVNPLKFTPLNKSLKTDVVIVGAGIAGLSIAYRLCQLKKKVVVIDDGFIGSGETGRTSAHLVCALDDRYYNLERTHGKNKARLAAQSHLEAIKFIESVIQTEKIDCDFLRVPGYLFTHPSDKKENLKKEFDAVSRAGVHAEMLDHVPGLKSGKNKACIMFLEQAEFHPLKYLQGLAKAIVKHGGQIYTETKAIDFDDKGVKTESKYRIGAKHIVVATNSPVNDVYKIHLKQFAFRTYLIGALIRKDSLPHSLWWDSGDFNVDTEIPPYHYVRVVSYDGENDLLLCGGEDHPTGLLGKEKITEGKRYKLIEKWLKLHFTVGKIVYQWSGQVMEPMDGLAFIGRNPADKKNVYIVTGDSGNGLTHGSIAGILIPDLIMGKENPWKKIYRPSRVKMKAGKTWLKEFGGGLISYLKESPEIEDHKAVESLKADEALMVKVDTEKFGVYNDLKDTLHFVNAKCTHLGCIVKWNIDEKSWDCPCHGSRFTYEGKVINGPAISNLEYFSERKEKLLSVKTKKKKAQTKKRIAKVIMTI